MLKLAIPFLLLLKIIVNICPNDCSGNGKCTKEGVCICHKQSLTSASSTIFGYTGADCSERVCPLGNSFVTPSTPSSVILQTTNTQTSGRRVLSEIEKMNPKTVENQTEISHIGDNIQAPYVEESEKNTTRKLAVTSVSFNDESGVPVSPAYKIDSSDFASGVFDSLECNGVKCTTTCDYLSDPTTSTSTSTPVTIWGYVANSFVILQFDSIASGTSTINAAFISTITSCVTPATPAVTDFTKFQPIVIGATTTNPITWTGYGGLFNTMGYISSTGLNVWCYHTDLTKVDGKLHENGVTITTTGTNGDDLELTITAGTGSPLAKGDVCYLMAKPDGSGGLTDVTPIAGSGEGDPSTGCEVCDQFTKYGNVWYKTGMTCNVPAATGTPAVYTMTIEAELSKMLAGNITGKSSFDVPNHCTGDSVKMLKNLHNNTELAITYNSNPVVSSPNSVLRRASELASNVYTVYYKDAISISGIDDAKKLEFTLTTLEEITPLENGDEVLYKVKFNYGLGNMGGRLECNTNDNSFTVKQINVWGYDGSKYSYISFDKNIKTELCLKPYTGASGTTGGGGNECTPNDIYPLDINCTGATDKFNDFSNYRNITIDTIPTDGSDITVTWTNFGTVFTDMKFLPNSLPLTNMDLWCYHFKNNIEGIIYTHKVSINTNDANLQFTITETTGQDKLLEGDKCSLMAKLDTSNSIVAITPTKADNTANGCEVCNQLVYNDTRKIWLKKSAELSCTVETVSGSNPIQYKFSFGETLTRLMINHYIDKLELKIPSVCTGLAASDAYSKIRKSANMTIKIDGYEKDKFVDEDPHIIYTQKKEDNNKNITITFRNEINFADVNFRKLFDTASNTKMIMSLILDPAPEIKVIESSFGLKIYKVPYNYTFQSDDFSIIGGNFTAINCNETGGSCPTSDSEKIKGTFWGFNTTESYTYLSFEDDSKICTDKYLCGNNINYPLDFNYTFNTTLIKKDLSNYIWNIVADNSTHQNHGDHIIRLKGFFEIFNSIIANGFTGVAVADIPVACYHPFKNIDSLLYLYDSTIVRDDVNVNDVLINITMNGEGPYDDLTKDDVCFILADKTLTKIDINANQPTPITSDKVISPIASGVCDQCGNFYYNADRDQWYFTDPDKNMKCEIEEIVKSGGDNNNIQNKTYNIDIGSSLTRLIINYYLLKDGKGTYGNLTAEVGRLQIPQHCTNKGFPDTIPDSFYTEMNEMIIKSANVTITFKGYGKNLFTDTSTHIVWSNGTDHNLTFINEFMLQNVSFDKMKGLNGYADNSITMTITISPAPIITYIQYNDYRIYKIPLIYDFSNNNYIRANLTVDSVKSEDPSDCNFQNEMAYFWGYDSNGITYISFDSYKGESTVIVDSKVCLDPYHCQADDTFYPLDFNYSVIEGSERVDFSDYKYISIDEIYNSDDNKNHVVTMYGYGTIFKSIGFFGNPSSSTTTTEKDHIPLAFYHPEKNKESLLYIYSSTIKRKTNATDGTIEDLVITIMPNGSPENNHTAVGDLGFILAYKNGTKIDINKIKPSGGKDNELINSTTSICDQCENFYYNNFRNQWFFGNPTNFSVDDPGMYCTVQPIGKGITDDKKYIYNITMDATFSRLIINHYLQYDELEIPYSNCSFLDDGSSYPDGSISNLLQMVRKSATVRIEISGYDSEEFEDVKTHMIYDVKNDTHYGQYIVVVTLREKLLFEKIRFRLLDDIMSDPNKLKMSIIVTPAPKLIPIYSNNELKVYRVPLNYSINSIPNKYIIKANLTCTSISTNRSLATNNMTSRTVDGVYWGYKYDIDIHNVISYISYNETLCDDPYGENNDKIENCRNKYAYDFDCKLKDNYTRVDLTDYYRIKLSNLNVTNKSFSWVGFSEILLANGWNVSNNDNIFEFKCYHGDKTDDYYSNLTHYEAIVSISSPNDSYPNEINFTPEDVNITINDTLNPNTLQEGDICFLLSTREGEVIELNTSNPVKPVKPESIDDCDACNVFYYDTIRKEYYIKEIYLHRIQSNYTEFPPGIYTNNTIIFSYGIISGVLDEYFNYSYYNLLKPTNKTSIPEFRKVIQPKNIIELSLSRPDPYDLSVRKVYYKEITHILTVEEKDDMFNISSYPPFLPLKKIFLEVNETKEIGSDYSNREAIIISHVILPNSDCNFETKICKHYLLSFNLPMEGGNLVISEKIVDENGNITTEVIGSGNVLSYKSSYPQVCFIQYKFNDEERFGGEDFYKKFNYTLYDYKISSSRNDLSTYSECKVESLKDDNNNTISTIQWKDYGKSIELMGLVDKLITMLCYTPTSTSTIRRRSLGEIEAKEYKANVTLYEEDIRFIFEGNNPPNVNDICYLTINGKGDTMKIKDLEASTFFIEKDDGKTYYTYFEPDEVIFTTITTTTITNDVNKTVKNDVIKAGSSIFQQMQEIYNEEDDEEVTNPTVSPSIDPTATPTSPPVKQPNFAIPLPKNEDKNVVISKVESNKWIKVQIYLGSIKVLESTVKITTIVRTTDNFVIVKITPSINLNLDDIRLRRRSRRRRRRRVLQDNRNPIIIITLDIETPLMSTDQVKIPYSGELNLKKEGGLLFCTNLNNGEKGVVDVTSYYKYNDERMMYVKFSLLVTTEPTTLSCQVAFKRNDFSLYTSSIVEAYSEEHDEVDTKHYFRITWEGYSAAFQELIKPLILPKTDLQEFKMLCFHPDGGDNKNDYKLRKFSAHIASIDSNLAIDFYNDEGDNAAQIEGDADNTNQYSIEGEVLLKVGDICYPMNYIKTTNDDNGETVSIEEKEIDQLDATKYFEYKPVEEGSDEGYWYYKTIKENEDIKSSITSEGSQIMYNEKYSEEVLEKYADSKEILIIVSDDEVSGMFKMRISNGMIIEIYIKGIDNGNGYEQRFIGQIGSIRSGDNENELFITTIEDFPDFPEIENPRRRSLEGGKKISNVVVTVTLRDLISDKLTECSGNGVCDRVTGKCNCFNGYTGISCQRLDCPNNCNKRGRCVPIKELLSENRLEESGRFGNEEVLFGCLCDKGYRGHDCSLIECPSGEDYLEGSNMDENDEQRDCSGRGICDYSTGICECFDGFSGEGCQYYQVLG